jgi:hypothetical protein
MALPFSLTEDMALIQALGPIAGTGAAQAATAVSLKLAHKLWAVVDVNSAGGADATAIVPQTDALVAFGSPAVLVTSVPIWAAAGVAVSPALVRAANAVNYTCVADLLRKQIVFEIDPAKLAAGEDCFRISLTAAVTTLVTVHYVIAPRYPAGSGNRPNYLID